MRSWGGRSPVVKEWVAYTWLGEAGRGIGRRRGWRVVGRGGRVRSRGRVRRVRGGGVACLRGLGGRLNGGEEQRIGETMREMFFARSVGKDWSTLARRPYRSLGFTWSVPIFSMLHLILQTHHNPTISFHSPLRTTYKTIRESPTHDIDTDYWRSQSLKSTKSPLHPLQSKTTKANIHLATTQTQLPPFLISLSTIIKKHQTHLENTLTICITIN